MTSWQNSNQRLKKRTTMTLIQMVNKIKVRFQSQDNLLNVKMRMNLTKFLTSKTSSQNCTICLVGYQLCYKLVQSQCWARWCSIGCESWRLIGHGLSQKSSLRICQRPSKACSWQLSESRFYLKVRVFTWSTGIERCLLKFTQLP